MASPRVSSLSCALLKRWASSTAVGRPTQWNDFDDAIASQECDLDHWYR
jgi:hypothetical protein